MYNGKEYPYLDHWHSRAWENDKAILGPIGLKFIGGYPGAEVLEIGNVLSHYYGSNHLVLDRYERNKYNNVLKANFTGFYWNTPFKRILSIDEVAKLCEYSLDPVAALGSMFSKVKRLLTPDGTALVTIPTNYSYIITDAITNNKVPYDDLDVMAKYGANKWFQVPILNVKYSRIDYGNVEIPSGVLLVYIKG
jgi:hypothetical protein